ncbi:uncharacterized protein [Castor canadensis]|uniref:Uncharacterized protein n=1 Tax=Castor canadensis TaxID=51338 RepID=A0AC58MPJ9_CASCN
MRNPAPPRFSNAQPRLRLKKRGSQRGSSHRAPAASVPPWQPWAPPGGLLVVARTPVDSVDPSALASHRVPHPHAQPQRLQSPRVRATHISGLQDLVLTAVSPHLPQPRHANPQQSQPHSYPPRPRHDDRRGVLGSEARNPLLSARLRRSLQPTAFSPAAPAASGPQACGWRKPEEGGADTISYSLDLAGERRSAQRRPESKTPASPRADRRARVWIPSGCAESLRGRGRLLLLVRWRQMRGSRGRPQVRWQRCNADRDCEAPHSPGRLGRSVAEPLPFPRGGHQPRALAGHPGQENH